MKYFSKTDIENLNKYEYYFTTVVKYGYKRNTTRYDNELIADIYEKATGEKLVHNYSCNQCVFNNFMTVGKLYFKSIQYWEEQDKNNEVEQLPTTTKKRGRKPSKEQKTTK